MAISLGEQIFAVSRVLTGSGYVVVEAGNGIKVEATGVEILDETVPSGKQWGVTITVRIEESNV